MVSLSGVCVCVAGHAGCDGDVHRLQEGGGQSSQEDLWRVHSQHYSDVHRTARQLPHQGKHCAVFPALKTILRPFNGLVGSVQSGLMTGFSLVPLRAPVWSHKGFEGSSMICSRVVPWQILRWSHYGLQGATMIGCRVVPQQAVRWTHNRLQCAPIVGYMMVPRGSQMWSQCGLLVVPERSQGWSHDCWYHALSPAYTAILRPLTPRLSRDGLPGGPTSVFDVVPWRSSISNVFNRSYALLSAKCSGMK